MKFPEYLKTIAKIPDEFEYHIQEMLTRKELPKGAFLFEQGKICRHFFFIEKGMARIFYYSGNDREITAWFFSENAIITAIDSLYSHKATQDNCELLEDSVVYTLNFTDFENLLSNIAGARMAFYVLYEITRKMSEYIVNTKFQSAEERYKSLLSEYPSVVQRAPLGYIASYLGITQETLSRIRAGISS